MKQKTEELEEELAIGKDGIIGNRDNDKVEDYSSSDTDDNS